MPEASRERIEALIVQKRPRSLAEAKMILKEEGIELSDEQLYGMVKGLQSVRALAEPSTAPPNSFVEYLANGSKSWWVYVVLAWSLVETILVLYGANVAEATVPRTILGLGVLGFVPGYSSQRAIFPENSLTILEQVLLSIFLSLIVSIGLGILLGFVYLFRAGPNVTLLNLYTFVVTLIAAYRSFLLARPLPMSAER